MYAIPVSSLHILGKLKYNGLHKISTGLEAVTYRTELNMIKGTTAQFGNIARINFMRCYAPFFLTDMKLDLITNKEAITKELNPNDEFYTPNYAIEPLLRYLKPMLIPLSALPPIKSFVNDTLVSFK